MRVVARPEAELVARRGATGSLPVEIALGDLVRELVAVHPATVFSEDRDHRLVQRHATSSS
jgi:hypothetical protein